MTFIKRYLGVAWAALALFLFYDAWQTGMRLEWILGAVAVLMAIGNTALQRRTNKP